jgi:GT2 family glycosyltransferase
LVQVPAGLAAGCQASAVALLGILVALLVDYIGCARITGMQSPDIGVVIVNYNTRDLLRRCLETVLQSVDVGLTVCVVDNASGDGSAEMVSQRFPDVQLIANASNVGYPAANNQGLRALGLALQSSASPRYALLLNADTELPPDALCNVVAFADSHPAAGVVGPKLVRPDGSLDLACRRSFPTPEVSFYRMTGLARLFPRSRRFGRYNLTYLDPDQTTEVDSVVGAFMLVRREVIDEVGMLDEHFFMYGEDLDWAYRIKAAGWRVYYYPEVTVLHVKRASSQQNPQAQVEFWRSMRIFYNKHYAGARPRLLDWLVLFAIGAQMKLVQWRINVAR